LVGQDVWLSCLGGTSSPVQEGEAPEGEAPEGEAPEGEAPEGEAPEGGL